jgi:hypothetical protein
MQGRPQLFPGGRQISVLVAPEDYQALTRIVEERRRERPGYSFGDLLRVYIRRALDQEPRTGRRPKLDITQERRRRLHVIARIATRLAREMGSKPGATEVERRTSK